MGNGLELLKEDRAQSSARLSRHRKLRNIYDRSASRSNKLPGSRRVGLLIIKKVPEHPAQQYPNYAHQPVAVEERIEVGKQ
jgi:hypothetical protein